MGENLKDRVAVVTGSGQGIGAAVAIALAGEGASIVTNNRTPGTIGGDAETTAKQIILKGGQAVAFFGDIAQFEVARDLVGTAVDSFGRLDILVNCAAISPSKGGPIWEAGEEDWDALIAVNLKGTFNTCRHALALMVTQNSGRIINFSSPSWLGIGGGAYAASKGAIVSFTAGIAQQMDLEGRRITCNTVVPIADTRMGSRKLSKRWEELYRAGLINRQVYEDSCDPSVPEEIAPIVLYLATDNAANINGHVFGATRGRVALYSEPTEIKGLYKEGVWTLDELIKRIPTTLAQDLKKAKG